MSEWKRRSLTDYRPLGGWLWDAAPRRHRPRSDGDAWDCFLPPRTSSPRRNITAHSCLKVYHKDPAQAFSQTPRPSNGDPNRVSLSPDPRGPPRDPYGARPSSSLQTCTLVSSSPPLSTPFLLSPFLSSRLLSPRLLLSSPLLLISSLLLSSYRLSSPLLLLPSDPYLLLNNLYVYK